ncbi:hypothetical protein Pelo_1884 [Pelomyxa schiedti]|nr:hypothetical protein Pelo_1884 [Pelomyxa schiedti]
MYLAPSMKHSYRTLSGTSSLWIRALCPGRRVTVVTKGYFPLDQSAANLSLGSTELLKVISTKSSAVSCIVITKSTTATNSVEALHSVQVSVGPKNLVLIITEPSDDSEQQSLLGSSERTIYLKHNDQCTNVEYTLKNVLEVAVECPFVVEAIFQPNGTTPSHQQNLFFPLKFQVTIYHKPGWANIQSRSIFKIEGNDLYVGQSCTIPHPISQEHPFRKTLLLDVPPKSRGVISPLPGQITFTITHGKTCFEGAFILPIDSTVAKTRDMVMKIIFNWENTPQEMLSRSKYMAECLVLSSFPNHHNVIHPLGALVIPCLPAEFVEKIPSDKIYLREQLCNNKSLAILMPHCGITLSSFFSSNSSNEKTAEAARDLFVQGLHAIYHIELHFVVHRDIKGDNILIDPETGKLTLIDFGEAQCCPNMEALVSTTSQAWGNPGTMPPELSIFLRRKTTETSVFSYSKCDSFALALTFWNALLPQTNMFIGSTMNHDMSAFNTQSLLRYFPVPLFSRIGSPSQQHLRVESPQPQPPPVATSQHQRDNVLESVMIGMMNPDRAARLSAAEAIQSLTL